MKNNPLPRLELNSSAREKLLPYCRLRSGDTWQDERLGHRIACIDASDPDAVRDLVGDTHPTLAVHDPPYNLVAFEARRVEDYIEWCRKWIDITHGCLAEDASLYVWLGADQTDGFQPLADFMIMMRSSSFRARSFITMRNQRGYGTQQNWMAVRQELLYYTKGRPRFQVGAEYTDIPKILRGYYKEIGGQITENMERSNSDNIRAGNVWVDIQQVFYRMGENVSGCYAQKPLKAIDRILRASSEPGEVIIDLFAHAGTTLLAAERLDRICLTADIDPLFCEISIRRLEHFRHSGHLGWQNSHAFELECPELFPDLAQEKFVPPHVAQTSLF